MPHITEEIYHLYFNKTEKKKSIHLSAWPEYSSELIDEKAEEIGDLGVDIINTIRKFKSENKMSMKEELSEVVILGKQKELKPILEDLKAVTKVKEIRYSGRTDLETERFQIKMSIRK
jgi:valyl-tRNA synthetase